MLIGVDIDGVLFPWVDVANEAVAERFGIPNPGPHTCWDYLKDVLPPEAWRWLWSAEGQDVVFGQVERTYADAVEAVNALLKAGHRVHFVTHRDPRRTAVYTAAFLHLHFGRHPWAGVHVVQNSVAKRRLQRWDVFIDDKPETVWDFLGYTDAQVFAPVRPWNVDELDGYASSATPGLVHYTDPAAIVEWVEARTP